MLGHSWYNDYRRFQSSEAKINWADAILVMEDGHKSRITGQYRHLQLPAIHVLHIEDEYTYMQAELVEILEDRIPNILKYEMSFGKED